MATREDVRRIASNLPGAVEGEGGFAFGIERRGKIKGFVWLWKERIHPKEARVANLGVLAIRTTGLAAKDVLLASNPAVYSTEPHYDGYPAVLVRLEAVGIDELEDLLTDAWKTLASKKVIAEFDRASKAE